MTKASLFASVFLLCFTPAVQTAEVEKVPITTSSPQALELYLQGRDLQEKLRAQEALAYLQKAVEQDPEFAMGYLNLAFSQPTGDGFFENLTKAVSLADQVSEGEQLWIRGVEAGVNGLAAKQRQLYEDLVAAYPKDERAHNLLGNHYFGQQNYSLAIASYEKAIAINPEFSQPYNQLGYSYRFEENYPEAEKAFQKYIELIPDDPNPHDSYAELLMKMGEFERSIEHYRQALSINKKFMPSYIGIATNLNLMGKHQEARQTLDTMYREAADDGQRRQALFARAVSFTDEGDTDRALEALTESYNLAQRNEDAAGMSFELNNMGNVLLEADRAREALARFEESIALTRGSDRTADAKENAERFFLFNSARAALRQKDLPTAQEKAAEHRRRAEAIGSQPQIQLTHELAGTIALEERDYATALVELEQANPLDPYILYRRGLAYQGRGDAAKARELFQKAANFNALNNLNYAFVRRRATERAS
ncbi:MAG: tetratricopeptide repeat protein [Vicinamibacteria bacterium]